MAVVLYGVAIHKAASSGDLSKMKAVRKQAEEWLSEVDNVKSALEVLKREISKKEKR